MRQVILLAIIILSLSYANASDTLTVRQVYNFNVGDTFDYSYYDFNDYVQYYYTTYIRKVIIGKAYSPNQDTIYYQYNVSQYGTRINPSQFIDIAPYDTITNLDSFAIYQTEALLSPTSSAMCNSAEYDTTSYFAYRSDSIKVNCFESNYTFRYTVGLGMTFYNQTFGGDPCTGTQFCITGFTYQLIRFANDSIHLGYNIIDGEKNLSTCSIAVYPDPAKDIIHLINPANMRSDAHFIMADMLGQIVYDSPYNIGQQKSTFDISNVQSGMYTWRVVTDNQTIKTGKIIKE